MKHRLPVLLIIPLCLILVFSAVVISRFLPANAHIGTEKDTPEADPYAWAQILINAENPIPEDYYFELKTVQRHFLMDTRCADYAIAMLDAAAKDGVQLRVVSAYRSKQRQSENIENYIKRLMRENKEMDREEAEAITASQIAVPGASEHNAGLALDILSYDWFDHHNDITEAFDRTPEFAWLEQNAHKFGFILRYPKGKEDITGFIYEPWHFRFVGAEKALEIKDSGLTLEEMTDLQKVN